MSFSKPANLTREQVAEFEREVNAIRNGVMTNLGQSDVNHIRRMIRICRTSEVAGRALLHFGVGPLSWVAGVMALANAKILDNMEIGHNVIHGQYDWMGDPHLNGKTYEWDIVGTADNWRKTHNFRHHTYTNVLGVARASAIASALLVAGTAFAAALLWRTGGIRYVTVPLAVATGVYGVVTAALFARNPTPGSEKAMFNGIGSSMVTFYVLLFAAVVAEVGLTWS